MKAILIISVFLVGALSQPASLHGATYCSCGSHSTGITGYSVSKGGCCSGSPGAFGIEETYKQGEGGTWELESSRTIPGSEAQSNCCPNG